MSEMEKAPLQTKHPWEYWNDSQRKKLLGLVASVGVLAPLTNAVVWPVLPSIKDDMGATDVQASLVMSMYILFMAVGLLGQGVLSDKYGRKPILLIDLVIHFVFSILCGFSWNIWSLIIFRAFQAIGASGTIAAGVGVVSDIFSPERRGRAMGYVVLGPLVGPLVGPIIGGGSSELFGSWRAAFFVVALMSAVFFVCMWLWMKETLPSIIHPEEHGEQNKRPHPLRALALAIKPKLIPYTLMGFVSQGMLYLCAIWISFALKKKYGLKSSALIGLAFSPVGAGGIAGAFLGGFLSDRKGRNYTILLFSPFVPPIMILIVFIITETIQIAILLVCTLIAGFVLIASRIPEETVGIDYYPEEGSSVNSGMRTLQQVGAATMMTAGVVVGNQIGKLETMSILGFFSYCTTIAIGLLVWIRKRRLVDKKQKINDVCI